MDAMAVTALLDAGLDIDKATLAAAVGATANTVDRAEADDQPLPPNVVHMLHLVFDANLRHLSERSKVTTNVTCMQLMELGLTSMGMSYMLDRLTTRPTTTLARMDLSRITIQEAAS